MILYCNNCEVSLNQINPEFRSLTEDWFPSETYKCLQCESCGFFVESHTKSWKELEDEAIATGRVTTVAPVQEIYENSEM
jgi:hypothetical protein